MTAKQVADKFAVSVLKHGLTKKREKWYAYRGGNGTGVPVENVAEAYTLTSLASKLRKTGCGKQLVEVL